MNARDHTTSPRRALRLGSPAGMTMLEVVLSTVLLSMISAAIIAAVAFVTGAERRRATRLEAYEIANRLMLQYSDDPTHNIFSQQSAPYRSASTGRVFRFEFASEPIRAEGRGARLLSQSLMLHARVYQGLETSGNVERGPLLADLSRFYNILQANFRNEDSGARTMKSQWFLESLMRISNEKGGSSSTPPASRSKP